MKGTTYFGYIRISDKKQQAGVSDDVQRADIERFAQARGLEISEWFEEVKTAAKTGRPVFVKMMRRLQRGEATGLIMHKVDRSARNLEDWLDIGRLVDQGIDVQFAHEPVDLRTTGGRFSADILAVSAAHYIRNLRDEAKKGFYGRLQQGLYPLPAPIGYIDNGKAKPKTIDPVRGPLVRLAFTRYATGRISLSDLADELWTRGLRTKRNNARVGANRLAHILHNPFYYGLVHIQRTGETFPGSHKAIVAKALFNRVQDVFDGKRVLRKGTHDFQLRRMIQCGFCWRGLTGEKQKGHVYYRCHTKDCPGASIREEQIVKPLLERFDLLRCDEKELGDIRDMIGVFRRDELRERENVQRALRINIENTEGRLSRLTDALIDGLLDKESFETRKHSLVEELIGLRQNLAKSEQNGDLADRMTKFFELGSRAYSQYKNLKPIQRRSLVAELTSNLSVQGKKPTITLRIPHQQIAEYRETEIGGPYRGRLRTLAGEIFEILKAAAIEDALSP